MNYCTNIAIYFHYCITKCSCDFFIILRDHVKINCSKKIYNGVTIAIKIPLAIESTAISELEKAERRNYLRNYEKITVALSLDRKIELTRSAAKEHSSHAIKKGDLNVGKCDGCRLLCV